MVFPDGSRIIAVGEPGVDVSGADASGADVPDSGDDAAEESGGTILVKPNQPTPAVEILSAPLPEPVPDTEANDVLDLEPPK